MLTKNEISTLSLSPTKKDFVQIWNELLDVAGKLSERWDPTSTNESDPGIVILKALTGIADKLNYNIDKNTLEAFMPTAAQEDSMRKLCDMLGYSMKYYRSAETSVTVKYYNSDPSDEEVHVVSNSTGLEIPKFTVITNADKDISYFTTNQIPLYISSKAPSVTVSCMEGQIVKCESTVNNNVITLAQLSEGNKFYLPETQIAENGIFIYNVSNDEVTGQIVDGTPWEKVDNLNVQASNTRVFKFGYNSYEGRPYVEFPTDCSELINDGLFIYYARTSGANGNVSVNTLTQIELPTGGNWSKVAAESFSATNMFAATSGVNLETIGQAYNNFKKTIGTFETLVTCRDYMNKIYSLSTDVGKPYVSNVLVTDIRNDLNRAITICSCDDAGIYYKEMPLTSTVTKEFTTKNGDIVNIDIEEPKINHFDLVIYPFKSYTQIRSLSTPVQSTYDASFTYNPQTFNNIEVELENTGLKTIAHNFVKPKEGDILSINNYLRLNAIVGTNNKVSVEEAQLIKEKIKIALANAFNMRELDFGEEIPFESIVDVIEHADSKIKVVSLNEPDLYTTFTVIDKVITADTVEIKEYAVASDNWLTLEQATASKRFETDTPSTGTFDTKKARELYNKLVVRNILAGRVPLFKYNTTFTSDFSEKPYQVTKPINPSSLPEACLAYFNSDINKDAPYLLWCDKDTNDTYARNGARGEPTNLDEIEANPDATRIYNYTCTKTESPKEVIENGDGSTVVTPKYPNNIITSEANSKITKIKSECLITSTDSNDDHIKDVTLNAGEQIKFRAKNFRTTETYPAYVNYHLHLDRTNTQEASPAVADTLFNLIVGQSLWDDLFNYTRTNGDKGVVTTFLKQDVKNGNVSSAAPTIDKQPINTILYQSSCIKFYYADPTLINAPNGVVGDIDDDTIIGFGLNPDIDTKTVLVYSAEQLNNILEYINSEIIGANTTSNWEISYKIEYVPFTSTNLDFWKEFVNEHIKFNGNAPASEGGNNLWRKYTGSSYPTGKYILGGLIDNGYKLLSFSTEYFGILDTYIDANNTLNNRLQGIYIAETLGNDAVAAEIANDTEYKLRDGEYLCIKYTPSSTSEDGTTDENQAPITKVIQNTIIRPNGFTSGLKDSTAFQNEGNSPIGSADFVIDGNKRDIELFSLGVNEQIEIREPSSVALGKDTFATDDAVIYVYKNFNDCPALETIQAKDVASGQRSSTYILKEGEYFFYTDKNKSELAYYSTGTGITLEGNVKIPTCDIIDISTILDSGISEIPWKAVSVSGINDKIIFQEYQYKTLGQNDKLNTLRTVGRVPGKLDGSWCKCADVSYTIAGETEPDKLPLIDIDDNEGNGWEACSLLEINVSPSVAQTLRNTDKVKTSIALYDTDNKKIKVIEAEPSFPLSFKANVTGQSSTGELSLSDIYLNTDAKSFTFKVTAEETPSVIQVQENSIIPLRASLSSGDVKITKSASSWSQVLLREIGSKTDDHGDITYNALKLSTTILPNTYGIFSIYLKQDTQYHTSLRLLPGSANDIISLFNSSRATYSEDTGLELTPGLNCIRISESCDIYITSNAPNGLLCFDTLRLVDVSKINDNQKTTHGLNLEQLGYLATSDTTTWNEIDSRARKNLKKALTEEALQKVEARIQELNNKVSVAEASLAADRPKAEIIKEFLKQAISELEALIKTDDDDTSFKTTDTLTTLITQFEALTESLSAEKELQKALDDNKAIEDITKSLADLLNNFDDISALQQSLIDALANLYSDVSTNMENIEELSQEDIVDDYNIAVKATGSSYLSDDGLKNALKVASLAKINSEYDNKLEYIVSELIASQEEELARKIYTFKYSDIEDLIDELTTALLSDDASSIENQISAISTAVKSETDIDYTSVAELLLDLRAEVKTLNISAILSKVNEAAENSLYAELLDHLQELGGALEFSNNSLINKIDEVLTLVYSKTDSNKDDDIVDCVEQIERVIWAAAKANAQIITTELTKITNLASKDTILALLRDSTILNRNILIEQLELAIQKRTEYEETVESFSNNTLASSDLPFGNEAIVTVWPDYMKKAIKDEVEPLYSAIRAIVRDLSISAAVINTNVLTDRPVLHKLANIKLFKKLYKQAKDLVYKSNQVSNKKAIVETLSNSALAIPEVQTKLNAFTETNAGALVIYNLATQLKSIDENDVLAQQQILTDLKEELTKLIQLDENLLKITAEMLSPSILLLRGLPEGDFYNEVRNFINSEDGIKVQVLDRDLDAAIDNIVLQLRYLVNTLTDYAISYNGALLPSSYIANLSTYKAAKDKVPVAKPTEWDIFKILLDDNLKAAWRVVTEAGGFYWIDSAGRRIGTTDDLADDYRYRYYNKNWYELVDNRAEPGSKIEQIVSINTSYEDEQLTEIVTELLGEDVDDDGQIDNGITALGAGNIPESFKEVFIRAKLEEQLLAEIRNIDKNNLFYYNTPVEADVAIDFNEGDSKLNTLMYPATNYDINNVNNSFVISKIDISYLDSGIQLARSSRL